MAGHYPKWDKFYNKLNLIFYGFIAFSFIPFAGAFLETQKDFPDPPFFQGGLLTLVNTVLGATTILLLTGAYLFRKSLAKKMSSGLDIDTRLDLYISEKVRYYILLELAASSAFVGLYLTKGHFFTALYLVVLFIFSLDRPSYQRVIDETTIPEKKMEEWLKGE